MCPQIHRRTCRHKQQAQPETDREPAALTVCHQMSVCDYYLEKAPKASYQPIHRSVVLTSAPTVCLQTHTSGADGIPLACVANGITVCNRDRNSYPVLLCLTE